MLKLSLSVSTALVGLLLLAGSAVGQTGFKSSAGVQCDTTTQQNTCPPGCVPIGNGPCGCGGPGWKRIGYLDMTDPTRQCPSTWKLITSPKRSCGRKTDNECNSVIFGSGDIRYSQVCGRIIGYQKDTPEAFARANTNTLDGPYVDGVSVTTSASPREHIWTFAAGTDETGSGSRPEYHCPCITAIDSGAIFIPSYVGEDYFCDSGTKMTDWPSLGHVYTDNPLWDGQGCEPTSNCCTFNNPPWFCKNLPQPTSDDIEVRICSAQEVSNEDIYVELIEIYVQ